MPNLLLPIIFVILLLLLLWLTWRSPYSTAKLRESLFRNVGMPQRNLVGFLLGAMAALLLLTSGTLNVSWAAWSFTVALGTLMFLLIVVRPNVETQLDRFSWGLLVIVVLGFGSGALIYQSRSWWIWLWNQYRRIDQQHELVLEFLFLLGVILGVFVVRNWGKEQKAFTESLSGLLGGTFIAAVFGESLKGQGLTTMEAVTYYGLGFSMSAAINLLVAARLTSSYTNKRSISSRSLLDFLYGSERARTIDGYFLKNFKEDPDYARRLLIDTLVEWRFAVQNAFAERLEKRRSYRERIRDQQVDQLALENSRRRLRELDSYCSKLREAQDDLQELQDEFEKLQSLPEPRPRKKASRLRYIEERMNELDEKINHLKEKCGQEQFEEWGKLKEEVGQIKPSYFYELIAVECDEVREEKKEKAEGVDKEDIVFNIVYKQIGSEGALSIEPDMLRVGVSVRWQDTLEYISAPGEYRQPFPYPGSVSGLALEFRKTIVMDRDLYKRFRNKKYMDGICPKDIEQDRGLDEIDYLSYIAIPIVSHPGSPGENPLGVVTIDCKLFVSRSELKGQPLKAAEGIFRLRMARSKLTEYANNLYNHDDLDVKYIESISKIITPVLELYSRCRVGAT